MSLIRCLATIQVDYAPLESVGLQGARTSVIKMPPLPGGVAMAKPARFFALGYGRDSLAIGSGDDEISRAIDEGPVLRPIAFNVAGGETA